jgi:putative ABC transport system permease protein
MNATLNPDLFVTPTQTLVNRTMHFPSSLGPQIAAVPGVERVQMVRDARIVFRRTPIMLVAVDINSVRQTVSRPPVEGDEDEMYRQTAAGRGLMASDNLARLQKLHVGDIVEIPAPAGVIRLPIVGIVVDYSDQQGTILMDRTLFTRYWHDDAVDVFRVYVRKGVNPASVRQTILDRLSPGRQLFVFTNADVKAYIIRITDQWFGLTSIQIAVAVLVAILGIVNTLTVSITDRRRELGVLQAVGGLRGQVRRTIWIEALSIGGLGLVLGFALGAIGLYYLLQIVEKDIAGMHLDYRFPYGTVLGLVPTILAAAFIAAIWPAESAVHGSLVEALEYE